MSDELKALAHRIAALEARVAELRTYLHSAVAYLSSDPASSLTKSRVILEKVLLALYRSTMKKEPSRPMIGDMLADKAFMATIPRRITARMNAIRDLSNLGPHGEEVNATDAVRVTRDLIDVLEWYVVHHDPNCRVGGGQEARWFLEILPQLRAQYPRYLRAEITSVRFVQSQDRCYLEITTAEKVNDYYAGKEENHTSPTRQRVHSRETNHALAGASGSYLTIFHAGVIPGGRDQQAHRFGVHLQRFRE
jgi:hypothetical protein